ncbi:galactan 5-O-arabinofuranosyltransferase [Antrihabitans cavernicola]|uniref:Galactan 5-O-arabinofuranosyltransferase n=1 Tax=Antrihabitans cavernicola TaxID=2495913 RepID=A0A5A7SK57_9NOCA|nr:galactan 5-O-arabinofuranosyltransferase [Spelaeibacter cavernicola]KAA0025053.1 arabinofuranosyltransferase [Spelaeibacter cavernicola]
MVVAAMVAAVVAAIGLVAFSVIHWPAFNASNVTRAITTVGQVASVAVVGLSVYLTRTRKWPIAAKLLSWAGLSAFVTVTLGMPLAATKLYLFGVSVDQEFRTEFLTRMTDTASLHDMTYADLPSFYPAGWFWVGGRVADLLGMAGWEAFKPYAIASLAVAAVVAMVLWSKLIRSDWAAPVALATTAVVLAYGSPEVYGAIIAVVVPPALILAWGGLYKPSSGWGAVVGTGVFLGISATFYTLYAGWAAFTVGLMALVAAVAMRSFAPIVRMVVAGAIAGVIALIVWLPFLLQLRHGSPPSSGTAFHYLPGSGAQLEFPMLRADLFGALCLIGTVWLVIRGTSSRRAQGIGIGIVAIYLWSLASMAATAAGTTLLSFRLAPILFSLFAAAGVFGFIEGARAIYQALNEPPRFRYAVLTIGVIGALAFSQNIPHVLEPEINTAYTDTDGNGVRADKRPPGAVAFYGDIDKALTQRISRPRGDIVVLTADTSFLSYFPYLGFQALTSHYANPLADFAGRAAAIKSWSELKTPDELVAGLEKSKWRAPDAILFRNGSDGYSLRLAEDVYPNDPNVRRYTVSFDKKLFDDPRFTVTDIGPFVLVTRN